MPFEKLGSSPFSTLRTIIFLTQSNALQSSSTSSSSAARYPSSSPGCSSARRARFTVETFTEPTFSAVPPMELK